MARRVTAGALILGLLAAAVGATGCGSGGGSDASSSSWSHLHSVRISVAQPGLPPPGGAPHVTSFTTPAQVAKVAQALNVHHIAAAGSESAGGCAGGFMIQLVIARASGTPTTLSTYRCGGKTFGGIAGDLPGFLSAVGAGSV
jgi:hypothetical protein